jgi:hypothetical protein
MLDIIKSNPGKRVLIITCRKTLVNDIYGRARSTGLIPTRYLDMRDKREMPRKIFLIVQGESVGDLEEHNRSMMFFSTSGNRSQTRGFPVRRIAID